MPLNRLVRVQCERLRLYDSLVNDYRNVLQGDENKAKRMTCTVNLLVSHPRHRPQRLRTCCSFLLSDGVVSFDQCVTLLTHMTILLNCSISTRMRLSGRRCTFATSTSWPTFTSSLATTPRPHSHCCCTRRC